MQNINRLSVCRFFLNTWTDHNVRRDYKCAGYRPIRLPSAVRFSTHICVLSTRPTIQNMCAPVLQELFRGKVSHFDGHERMTEITLREKTNVVGNHF